MTNKNKTVEEGQGLGTTQNNYKSRFSNDQPVRLQFSENQQLENCEISAVTFTNYGKVRYNVRVILPFKDDDGDFMFTTINGVDSVFVQSPYDINKSHIGAECITPDCEGHSVKITDVINGIVYTDDDAKHPIEHVELVK